MNNEELVREVLGARPLGQPQTGGRQPTTRLDYIRVITRIYDEQYFPLLWVNKKIFSFTKFTAIRIANTIEFKFFEW